MPTTISQVQLSNTFNEFRTTFNTTANVVNSFGDGTGDLIPNTINVITASANNLAVPTLTQGRIVVVGASGALSDDSGLTYNTSTDTVSAGNVSITNSATIGTSATVGTTLGVTGATTLSSTLAVTGNASVGTNKVNIIAANGDFISTGNVNLTGGTSSVDAYDVHASEHVGVGGELSVWVAAKGDTQSTHKLYAIANTNAAIDALVVNQSDGANAYGEFIAIHHSGNTDQGWISMGINSTNYAEGAYGITKAEDGYILYQAPQGTVKDGDLVIGTGSNGVKNRIIFCAEGFDDPANNTQLVINPGQNIHIEIDTESSNTTTGALTVNGGIGLVGNLNIGGNVAITGTITLGGGGNTVSTSSLTVDNPIIFVGNNNAADSLDLGFVGEYTSSGVKYTGLVRDASDSGIYKLFSGVTSEPSNTVNFTSATYSTLQLGTLKAVDTTASSSTTTGALIVSGGAGIAGNAYVGGTLNATGQTNASGGLAVTGKTSVEEVLEKVTVSATAATGTINFDALTQGVLYYTSNASGNWTLNVRGNSGTTLDATMSTGQAFTFAFMVTNGSTAYRQTGFTIDGSSVTPKWQNGAAPAAGNANSVDIYSITIVKTGAATFTAFASLARFA